MLKKLAMALVILALLAPAAIASDLWVHVHVNEAGENGEEVRVNVPISMIEAVLPMIEEKHFKGGKVVIGEELETHGFQNLDLQKLWESLRDTPDGEYVTVKSRSENVLVAKEKGFFLVKVDSSEDGGEKVRVKMPVDVIQALLSSGADELDLMAGLRALGSYNGDLVTVEESSGTTVRVWIDDQQAAE